MKGMIIKRHDEAVRTIYWALRSSKKGNATYEVDLKDPSTNAEDGEDDLTEDPAELQENELHDHAPRPLPTSGEGPETNRHGQDRPIEKRRAVPSKWLEGYVGEPLVHNNPDIVRYEPIPGRPTKRKITIIEVGYCLEAAVANKIEQKKTRYQPLATALTAAGNVVQDVVVIPLPVRGGIPHSTRDSLISLGMDTWVVDRVLRKLHVAACIQVAHLCHRRRQIESERGISYQPGRHKRRTP